MVVAYTKEIIIKYYLFIRDIHRKYGPINKLVYVELNQVASFSHVSSDSYMTKIR